MRSPLILLAVLLSGCAATLPAPEITITGTVVQDDGKFYLQGDNSKYHLNSMPQLHYDNYLGRELVVKGQVPEQCNQVWQDAIVKVGDDAEMVDMNRVDWSPCIEPQKVSLVTDMGNELVYDWQKIDLQDYYF
ncbi:hypothetical protein [Microbulbifer hainanensis]|uniref:hypothetical protein n=1 Tax=Microbulbifer hainanensis TaxID=2735675 RepID=UPI001866EC10|nr:hypothetical protein [Microbulbifer hainanensis]